MCVYIEQCGVVGQGVLLWKLTKLSLSTFGCGAQKWTQNSAQGLKFLFYFILFYFISCVYYKMYLCLHQLGIEFNCSKDLKKDWFN